ncbi:hypothetical protein EVAR_90158_1 [Eumeta japonica]|uniref:Uncharacterized protein n=1 Tax=Eumeta variegata TaxID=151549 RepID=A0A4C1Z7U0_EUMVA|nr:hypothetical protein EVAR_90158_1 [Eumeta japonica]
MTPVHPLFQLRINSNGLETGADPFASIEILIKLALENFGRSQAISHARNSINAGNTSRGGRSPARTDLLPARNEGARWRRAARPPPLALINNID